MHGRDPIYPNVYSILVGDAGNGKSMAIGDVRELLTEIDAIPIAASIETPEGLLRRLAGRPDKDPPEPYIGAFEDHHSGRLDRRGHPGDDHRERVRQFHR